MAGLSCDDVRELAGAYVLDALEPDEALAVAEHLATCPESHEELFELGGVVPYLAETVELVEPPAELRGRILAAATKDLEARAAGEAAAVTATSAGVAGAGEPAGPAVASVPLTSDAQAPESIDDVRARGSASVPGAAGATASAPAVRPVPTAPVPIQAPRRAAIRPVWLVGLAAVLAIVALGAWNVSLQRDLSNARDYQARVSELLALARAPGARIAILSDSVAGPNAQPNGLAVMPADQPGRLVVTGLTPTTGNQAYVAWAIVAGQAPVPIGSFTVGSDGVGHYDNMPAAPATSVTLAVTLEPVSTVTAPSGPIVSSGQVPAAG